MKYNGDTLFENLKEVTAIMKKLLTLVLLVSLCLSGCALGNNVSDILKCRIENNFSSLYFIKLKNERYFCPPKAKAPVIFKVKIASTLAFHI